MGDYENNVIPILPFGGANDPNSGYAGSETSEARAHRDDADGTTGRRQQQTIVALANSGATGLTWRELADRMGWHHGQASGVLSVLHKAGRAARLREVRNRCKVYVLPTFIDNRRSEPYARTATRELLDDAVAVCRSFMSDCGHGVTAMPGCRSCEAAEIVRRYQNS